MASGRSPAGSICCGSLSGIGPGPSPAFFSGSASSSRVMVLLHRPTECIRDGVILDELRVGELPESGVNRSPLPCRRVECAPVCERVDELGPPQPLTRSREVFSRAACLCSRHGRVKSGQRLPPGERGIERRRDLQRLSVDVHHNVNPTKQPVYILA